jgi:hypothetical protein
MYTLLRPDNPSSHSPTPNTFWAELVPSSSPILLKRKQEIIRKT